MFELMIEILAYLAVAFLIGLILGYLFWGWGRRRKIEMARAEGASSVRTSVDGDLPLKNQLEACQRERKRLEQALDRSKNRVARLETELEEAKADTAAETDPGSTEVVAEETNDGLPDASGRPWNKPDVSDTPQEDPPLDTSGLLRAKPRASEETSDLAYGSGSDAPAEPLTAPTSLLTEAPAEVDDLKRIKGVGPVMEGVLNRKGVYLFRQIANFTDQDVAWVNSAIDAFPGRVERDDWVGQAQSLYRLKYGRDHNAPD